MTTSKKAPMRLSVNLAPDVQEAMVEMARERSCTISEIVRDAIATEYYLFQEVRKGSRIYVQEQEQDPWKEIIFRGMKP